MRCDAMISFTDDQILMYIATGTGIGKLYIQVPIYFTLENMTEQKPFLCYSSVISSFYLSIGDRPKRPS